METRSAKSDFMRESRVFSKRGPDLCEITTVSGFILIDSVYNDAFYIVVMFSSKAQDFPLMVCILNYAQTFWKREIIRALMENE
jgi:ABC-type antimicrobial peptide transport system permease subunit